MSPVYWLRSMAPFITKPVMHTVVDRRLRASLELLADTSASTPEQVDAWWQASELPTNMGGDDVGGNEMKCDPCYASGVGTCWARLSVLCTNLAGVDICTSALPTPPCTSAPGGRRVRLGGRRGPPGYSIV